MPYDLLLKRAGLWFIAIAVFLLIDYLSSVLLPFFVAWIFAYLLYPMVSFVDRRLHTPRGLSILLTLIVVIAFLAGVIFLIIPPMIEQFEKLGALATDYIQKTAHINSIPDAVAEWVTRNQQDIEKFFKSKDFADGLKEIMPGVFSFLGHTYSVIMSIVASFITLLYMFFILLDYEYLSENWIRIFPKKLRPFWHELMGDAKEALNNYVRGQGLVALIMGILFCIGFTIINFPMVFIVVQIICDMVVTPKVMGSAMGMNPAILLLSLSVWGALLGFIGLIIALPLTSLLIAYYQRYVTKESKKGPQNEKSPE